MKDQVSLNNIAINNTNNRLMTKLIGLGHDHRKVVSALREHTEFYNVPKWVEILPTLPSNTGVAMYSSVKLNSILKSHGIEIDLSYQGGSYIYQNGINSIKVDVTGGPNRSLYVLAHELVHATQHELGYLKFMDTYVLWKGEKFYNDGPSFQDYIKLYPTREERIRRRVYHEISTKPWELEAYSRVLSKQDLSDMLPEAQELVMEYREKHQIKLFYDV